MKPDIVVFGKAMTNGLNPISGVMGAGSADFAAKFPPGSTHSTFASNPLGNAAALATLNWIEQQHYEKRLSNPVRIFCEQLEALKKRHAQSVMCPD